MARISLYDRQRELEVFRARTVVAGVISLLLIGVLAARLMVLQVFDHDVFSTLSQNNRLRLMAVAPNRGLIYDRNGVILAENRPGYQLEIVPEEVGDLPSTLKALQQWIELNESDIERFQQARKRGRSFEGVPLKFNLSEDEVAEFSVNRHRFPGVDIAARLVRHYPFGKTAAHVLGYVGRIDEDDLNRLDEGNYRATSHIGKIGIEQFYETRLHGTAGFRQAEVNVQGRVLHVADEQSPVPGSDLHLTLDIRLQKVAEAALGERAGSVVALDPNTGAVLAMVSAPSYDPQLFVNGISRKDYRALRQAQGRPLFNRSLRGQYPPGSTIKPLIGLAALETAELNPERAINCRGYYRLPGEARKYRDWKRHGKNIDLREAIVQSCDVFFYELAQRMGIDPIAAYLMQANLGAQTGIDLHGEKPGLVPSRQWKRERLSMPWFPGETLIAGIGQGYMLTTPLQLAQMTAILANGGQAYAPHLLAAVEQPDGDMKKVEPSLRVDMPVQETAHWAYIHQAMVDVMHDKKGTARAAAYGAPYRLAGKTGTAQVISVAQDEEYDEEKIAERYRDHALFVGYAPADDPRIVVAVLVENGGSGSSAAAPVARKVMDRYLISKEQS